MNLRDLFEDNDFEELAIEHSRIGLKVLERAIVKSELSDTIKKQLQDILNSQLQKEKIRAFLEKIVETRRFLNLRFKADGIDNAYSSNEKIIYLLKPCNDEADFNNLIMVLSGIIDADLMCFKEHVVLPKGKTGSISAFEEYLNNTLGEGGYNQVIIKNLRDILVLRSKKFPTHVDSTDWIKKVKSLGFVYPINDWQSLGFKCIELYFESIANTLVTQ